ncbi:MAG TPA: hypothetical protein VFW68_06520 [Rhodocyclaceae bacterium]|nr:hypothetical protein [Rhodocyclaceae bacterium]
MDFSLHDRTLHLTDAQHQRHVIALDAGGCHQLVLSKREDAKRLVSTLAQLRDALVLPSEGGLLGLLSIRDNLALGLRYQGRKHPANEALVADAFERCGYNAEKVARLADQQPVHLPRIECWLVGFVRALALEPALLVIDNAFVGLASREDADKVVRWSGLFTHYYPQRPLLFVDVDSHAVPVVDGCPRIVG